MKQVLILLVFGLPASLVLLAVGGDLMLSGEPEPPRMAAEEEEPPPEPIDAGDSPIRPGKIRSNSLGTSSVTNSWSTPPSTASASQTSI